MHRLGGGGLGLQNGNDCANRHCRIKVCGASLRKRNLHWQAVVQNRFSKKRAALKCPSCNGWKAMLANMT